jgi:hypothetical protein
VLRQYGSHTAVKTKGTTGKKVKEFDLIEDKGKRATKIQNRNVNDGPRATGEDYSSKQGTDKTLGTCNGEPYAISHKPDVKSDAEHLEHSKVEGTKRREVGIAEKVRRQNNASRDGRSNLGVGKPATIVEG